MAKAQQVVKISAGLWRSRLLKFPEATGLRPTPDRVRQTVFNWLGQDLTGKVCLDLFSGTGVMGFEALSRGAKSVTLIEKNVLVVKALKDNQRLLHATSADIVQKDALAFLAANVAQFDVVFCDPPYDCNMLNLVLPLLHQSLSPNGVVYAEAEYAIQTTSDWQVLKNGKAGNVYYHLLKSNHEKPST